MRYTLSLKMLGVPLLLLCGLHLIMLAKVSSAKSINNSDYEFIMPLNTDLNLHDIKETVTATGRSKATSVLSAMELELFVKSLTAVSDSQCRNDLNATLNGILTGQHWAIAMYDSTVRTTIGIETGVMYQFGHFDECLEQFKSLNDEIPVRAKYCLADVTLDGLTVLNIDTRKQNSTNYAIAHWGACVPASCRGNDVENYLSTFLQRPVKIDEDKCQMNESNIVISNGMFIYVVVIILFVSLAIMSTAYHIYLLCMVKSNDKLSKTAFKYETITIALLSFSVIENTKKLFQASKEQHGLNAINGIKALAMLLILVGHALSFIFGGPGYNTGFISERIKQPTFAFLSNSLLFVDVFLLLSGFLFCRILLAELERRRGKINVLVLYAGRYIRLTPAYMAIMGFYMTWFIHIGSGPIWKQRIAREQQRCEASWWINLFYINNYINTQNLCMFQSWYLCVDSQMFFVAPIAIYLLYKSRALGVRLLSITVIVTSIIPFVATYLQKLDPTLLVYADEMNDLATNAFYVGSYIKTHMRASAYVLGLFIGFLVHYMQENSIKLSKYFVCSAWLLSIVVGICSMFSVSRFYNDAFTNLESTLYAGLHKIGWNLSTAWLVLAVTTNHAGCLQRVLSNRVFAPISRLAYCAYLTNGLVELYHSSNMRMPLYMSYINLTNSALGHIFDTFILAFLLCLLFESPIHALERILLRKFGGRERSSTTTNLKKSNNSQTPSTSEEQVA